MNLKQPGKVCPYASIGWNHFIRAWGNQGYAHPGGAPLQRWLYFIQRQRECRSQLSGKKKSISFLRSGTVTVSYYFSNTKHCFGRSWKTQPPLSQTLSLHGLFQCTCQQFFYSSGLSLPLSVFSVTPSSSGNSDHGAASTRFGANFAGGWEADWNIKYVFWNAVRLFSLNPSLSRSPKQQISFLYLEEVSMLNSSLESTNRQELQFFLFF